MHKRVKLFKNGRSQAVRLPVAFRFKGDSVFIRRDENTGDVILSQHGNHWAGLFKRLDAIGPMTDLQFERQQDPVQERDFFK
jgi:antitoxin VapB